ncbi:PhoH family protein [Candidatus Venteria ishoeyi]|uniref:PhoH-like protein n=1 Tax=Candidatus Venteria ishoeyi TaxID=1899563 RepID=A0A1H6FAD6_9GAMM|nr:PhoH family protein [Candidatus Venteria ishoeyi]MDM8547021.1 PhoH family protein [Candidatus Venteria ishoeyi]SEH04254.1 PhoH-like protein [Candidatus Venteria ishoeyi]SEH06583.1 PhoH-like protein [Candidatus Venteria ishoeyi]
MTSPTSSVSPENTITQFLELTPQDNQRLANFCGQFDSHLRQLEQRFGVEIHNRGHQFNVTGIAKNVEEIIPVLRHLYATTKEEVLDGEQVHIQTQAAHVDSLQESEKPGAEDIEEVRIRTRRGVIKGRGVNQCAYLRRILTHDINFGIGPAGTGKTYLAVACAVEALEQEQVRRLVLVRPAVEAGEKLGFLPGDLAQKVDPYLRPLYDALFEMFGFERVDKLIERNVIEVAPLAYMRGRSLNESFIILDEAQNTSIEQMKMFLTRIGFGSTAVITGDVTQVDLPRNQRSGLSHVMDVLQDIDGISFTFLDARDVVRHPLVGRIINAYERAEAQAKKNEA